VISGAVHGGVELMLDESLNLVLAEETKFVASRSDWEQIKASKEWQVYSLERFGNHATPPDRFQGLLMVEDDSRPCPALMWPDEKRPLYVVEFPDAMKE